MKEKNILLTGHSKGLGLTIAKVLLEQGCTVYGISRTSSNAEIDALRSQFEGKLYTLSYDLSDADNVNKTVFKDWIGDVALHGYVNNAAMAYDTLLTNMKVAPLTKMTMVNQFTPMMMTKSVIRNMLLHNVQGSIVHISSISVHTGYKGLSMYAATKGALEAFSKNTAREWGGRQIRSNCLVAGFMETEMSSTLDDEKKNRIYNRTSLKKATEKESVAEMVAFLLSDKAKSITGQNIHVDSGTI